MNSRRPAVPGSLRYDRVVRTVTDSQCRTNAYGHSCPLCNGPFGSGQRVTLTEEIDWAHLGCKVRAEQEKAGQLPLWS